MKKYLLLIGGWVILLSPSTPCNCLYQALPAPVTTVVVTIPQVERLARISYAEARGEPDMAIMWVAQTVINRKTDSNTIWDVISEQGQFDGYNNPNYCEPVDTHIYRLCKIVYKSKSPLHNYKYFLNPKISTDSSWLNVALKSNGKYVGSHWFFNP